MTSRPAVHAPVVTVVFLCYHPYPVTVCSALRENQPELDISMSNIIISNIAGNPFYAVSTVPTGVECVC